MIRWLADGIGGSGKTYFAIRAVKELGGVVIDTDDGWAQSGLPYAEQADVESGTLAGKVVYIPVDSTGRARQVIKAIIEANRAGKPITNLIVFDGFSEYQTKKSLALSGGAQMEQRDWGKLLADELGLIQLLMPRETGANLYATARMRELKDPTKPERTLLRPSIQGRFGQEIESWFDIVSPMFHETKENPATGAVTGSAYRVYFRKAGDFTVLTRDPWGALLPPYIETTLDEQGKVVKRGPDLLDMLVTLKEVEPKRRRGTALKKESNG